MYFINRWARDIARKTAGKGGKVLIYRRGNVQEVKHSRSGPYFKYEGLSDDLMKVGGGTGVKTDLCGEQRGEAYVQHFTSIG